MAALPLTLHAQPSAWRVYSTRKADSRFASFRDKVWERDNYTCQYCGFQAMLYQDVVNKDNDYRNSRLDNLVTACCFCSQCLFIESINYNDFGGGTIIHLPQMSQSELNGLCHVLFCAIANATSYRADAQALYRSLKFRAQLVEQTLGEGMSNPARLGQVLIDAPIKEKAVLMQKVFSELRLLPSRTKFSAQINHWAQAAMEEVHPEEGNFLA